LSFRESKIKLIAMASRVVAFALIVATAAVGVFPSVDGWRCAAMGRRMVRRCCNKSRAPEPTAFKLPCCERVAALKKDPRATSGRPEARIAAPVVVGLVAFAPILVVAPAARPEARPRGQPPGERLHDLSTVLRV
jgi:hypothetical protein